MRRHVAFVVSFSLLSLVASACGRSSSDGDSKSDKGSSKSTTESTASKPTGSGSDGASDKPSDDGVSAPPADPLDDTGSMIASCDQPKDDGACTEHYALGLGEDASKQFCENAMKGTWLKGKGCPKEGRIAVCRTDVDRMIYYKNAFELQGPKEMAKLCTETLSGKWGEFPKGK